MQPVRLILKVNSFNDAPYSYPFCKVCLHKIQSSNNGRSCCGHCGFWQRDEEVQHRYRMTFGVTNSHRLASVTVFGKSLERMFGESADQFNKYLAELESVPILTENGISVHHLLRDAVRDVFCGHYFSFKFALPRNTVRSQTDPDLKWLQSVSSGDQIAQEIAFASSLGSYGDVKDAMNHIIGRLLASPDSSSSESSCLSDDWQLHCLKTPSSSSSGTFLYDTLESDENLAPETPRSVNPYHSLLQDLTFSPWTDVDTVANASTPLNAINPIGSSHQKSGMSRGKCIRELLPDCQETCGEKSRSCKFLNLSRMTQFLENSDSSICDLGCFRNDRHCCQSSANVVDGSLSPDMFV